MNLKFCFQYFYFTGIISVLVVLVLPCLCGPILAFLLILCNAICKSESRQKQDSEFGNNFLCISLLTIVFVIIYSINMIISEVVFDNITIMSYVILKYIMGTSHNLFSPLVILISYEDVRTSVVKIFVKGGSQQNNSVDISDEDVKKELGHLNC